MSQIIADIIQADGALRLGRQGAVTAVDIPADGILEISVDSGCAITVGNGGALQLAGIRYIDTDGQQVVLEPEYTDVRFFRAAVANTITVLHNRTVDLDAVALPATQRISTSSSKDFVLSTNNSQAYYAYSPLATDFRWVFRDFENFDANPSDYAGTPPNTIHDALTRMGALLAVLNGAPIPE